MFNKKDNLIIFVLCLIVISLGGLIMLKNPADIRIAKNVNINLNQNQNVNKIVNNNANQNFINIPEPTDLESIERSVNYSVIMEKNQNDKTKADVYLKNPETNQEIFYFTLSNIPNYSYHNAEYHNGNFYVIHRFNYNYSSTNNSNWTDELWRYNKEKQGEKLYSTKGLNFRVFDNEKTIALITNNEIHLLDNNGNEIKSFKYDETAVDFKYKSTNRMSLNFVLLDKNFIWLKNTFGPMVLGLIKIDKKIYSIKKFDLQELEVTMYFSLNPLMKKIVFSNYPIFFVADEAEEYQQSGEKVNLFMYDLNTKKQDIIATSITKRFNPKWLDENTLEYDDPNSVERITKQFF